MSILKTKPDFFYNCKTCFVENDYKCIEGLEGKGTQYMDKYCKHLKQIRELKESHNIFKETDKVLSIKRTNNVCK